MANLNIKTQKLLSPENIKRIISLGISLKDSISTLEDKCIEDYDATKTYVKNTLVIYNGYIYKTKTVATGDFDENKFEKIGDNLDFLTLDDIKALINLSDEEITSLQSLISTEIRLDKCLSSSDTYNRILNATNECKKFTLEQLAKKAGVVYKIVDDTTGVDSTEFLYLISNGSNGYNIYAYIDGSAVKIFDTNINLDDYAKLSDLDNYYDKATSDGKYATITTVDGKVDKTSILSTISSTPSDDKLLSEKAIGDTFVKKTDITSHTSDTDIHITTSERTKWNEVDNKANGDEVVKKTDISTTIDSTSTEDTVPSTKAVWDKILDSEKLITKDNDEWVISGSLEKICTTSATDVPPTDITITGSNVSIKDKYNLHKYCVINGICYVSLNSLEFNSNFSSSTPITTLPKPVFRQAFLLTNVNGSVILGRLNLQDNGKLYLLPNVTPVPDIGHISFSYPVAK